MRKCIIVLVVLLLCMQAWGAKRVFTVTSPNGKLVAEIRVGNGVGYDMKYDGRTLLRDAKIGMTLTDGRTLDTTAKLKSWRTERREEHFETPIYKKAAVDDCCEELVLEMKDFRLRVRAYDEGLAYRLEYTGKTATCVEQEQTEFRFTEDFPTLTAYANTQGTLTQQMGNSFEKCYVHSRVSELDSGRIAFLPLLVDAGSVKLCLTEANLENYPGLFLRKSPDGKALMGLQAQMPLTVARGGVTGTDLKQYVQSTENYLAEAAPGRTFPWRIVAVAETDGALLSNDMVYRLAEPSRLADDAWVRPGKVAWEWWNSCGLYGVPFEAGLNTDTYKYYIDFAQKNGVEYIILDGGWSVGADLLQVRPSIDLPELIRYGKERGVGVILWAAFWHFDKNMEEVCRHYAEMGVKGFKLDFVDRDDALAVDFHYRAAAMAAKYRLMIDFHGTYKPTGLSRTYPNVLSYEGVNGQEQNRWSTMEQYDQVQYDVEVPFIRMLAGPMDYTPGAMLNATQAEYRYSGVQPMSQGTRCHQLAQYVVFFSPLQMLCDSPSNYEREPLCTTFIAGVPTTWDETRPLKSEIGAYVGVARRKGTAWYVGILNNWTPRTVDIALDFLTEGRAYVAEQFCDGPNADKHGKDFLWQRAAVRPADVLHVTLAGGGGFAMKLTEK